MSITARAFENTTAEASARYLKNRLSSSRAPFVYRADATRSEVYAALSEEKRFEESHNRIQFSILSVRLEAKAFQKPHHFR